MIRCDAMLWFSERIREAQIKCWVLGLCEDLGREECHRVWVSTISISTISTSSLLAFHWWPGFTQFVCDLLILAPRTRTSHLMRCPLNPAFWVSWWARECELKEPRFRGVWMLSLIAGTAIGERFWEVVSIARLHVDTRQPILGGLDFASCSRFLTIPKYFPASILGRPTFGWFLLFLWLDRVTHRAHRTTVLQATQSSRWKIVSSFCAC